MLQDGLKDRKIWLYQKPVDFRKQMDGLMQLTASELELDPSDGSIYIFRNKQKDKMKLLIWERNGYFLGYKRLEKWRFDFPVDKTGQIQISLEELEMLISGMPMINIGKTKAKTIAHF